MKQVFCLLGLVWMLQVALASPENPRCSLVTLKAQNKMILLPGPSDRHAVKIYFLHNTSQQSLWLDHHREKQKSANAGWSSYLRPGKWSAIMLTQQNFALSCAIIHPGKVEYQTCTKTISVCTPNQVSFKTKRQGSYWLAEDQTFEELEKTLGKRGILIKTH
jgi:hypothetical protein